MSKNEVWEPKILERLLQDGRMIFVVICDREFDRDKPTCIGWITRLDGALWRIRAAGRRMPSSPIRVGESIVLHVQPYPGIEELEAIAIAAGGDRGIWTNPFGSDVDDENGIGIVHDSETDNPEAAKHIAATCPAETLKLIATLRGMEADVDALKKARDRLLFVLCVIDHIASNDHSPDDQLIAWIRAAVLGGHGPDEFVGAEPPTMSLDEAKAAIS